MTLVTGTVQDLGHDGMDGTLWARPARFRSDGSVVYAPERKPFKITGGVVSAELAPGPAVLELQVGSHARGTFEVVIPDQADIDLADLMDAVFPWEPEQVSLFVAEREAAEQAKADAETAAGAAEAAAGTATTAAQQTGQDRTHVDQVRTELEEAYDESQAGQALPPRLTEAALNATYADRELANAPLEHRAATDADYPPVAETPRPVAQFDGHVWGAIGNQLHQSTDGKSWQPVGSPVTGATTVRRVALAEDGEMVAVGSRAVFRSTGWAASPATATWRTVLQTPDADTAIPDFGMDFNDPQRSTFVISHYTGTVENWYKSRYVWLTRDGGSTWAVAYDAVALFGETEAATTHVHGICYDPWEQRLWVSEGHEGPGGVRWSDDWGQTWVKVTKGELADAGMFPTTLVATPTGICCASDSQRNGVYGIARTASPADLAIEWTWQWRMQEGWSGAPAFGQGGWYDPRTETAYIGFQTSAPTLSPIVVAGDALSMSPILTVPKAEADGTRSVNFAFATPDGKTLLAVSEVPGKERIIAALPGKGQVPAHTYNRGNIFGGEAPNAKSMAVGLDARVEPVSRYGGTAVGVGANVGGHEAVAVGHLAKTLGARGVTVGYNASSVTLAVAIGSESEAGAASVVVGSEVNTTAWGAVVAVGHQATVGGNEATVVGANAAAFASSVSVGVRAKAGESTGYSVAVGFESKTLAPYSVAIGRRTSIGASTSSTGSTVVGDEASATSHASVAIGRLSKTANAGVAVGALSEALFTNAVAIGYNTKATDANQVAVGTRYFEVGTVANPGSPAAGMGRVYLFDNAGTIELRVRTAAGIRRAVFEAV